MSTVFNNSSDPRRPNKVHRFGFTIAYFCSVTESLRFMARHLRRGTIAAVTPLFSWHVN